MAVTKPENVARGKAATSPPCTWLYFCNSNTIRAVAIAKTKRLFDVGQAYHSLSDGLEEVFTPRYPLINYVTVHM